MNRPRQSRKVILANILLCGLAVLAVELFNGNWFKSDGLYDLGVPVNKTWYYHAQYRPNGPVVRVRYSRDWYGLRGSYTDPSAIAFLAVGGSTTDEAFISDGSTWCDVLQELFYNADRQVYVANAGISGHSTAGHLLSFEKWLPRIPGLSPDYTLFYVGINDVMVDHAAYDKLQRYADTAGVVRHIQERSALWRLYRIAKGAYQARKWDLNYQCVDFGRCNWTTNTTVVHPEETYAVAIASYAARLDQLARRSLAMGAIPVFVTQPRAYWRTRDGVLEGTSGTVYEGTSLNGLDIRRIQVCMDAEMKRIAGLSGGVFIDLAGEIELSQDDFFDFNHVNPSGAGKVASFLYSRLKDFPLRDRNLAHAGTPGGDGV